MDSISLQSYYSLGTLNIYSNQLTLTAIKPDNGDTSGFIFNNEPVIPDCTPCDFQNFSNYYSNKFIDIDRGYARGVMPDWVDVFDGNPPAEDPWQTVPTVDEAKVEFVLYDTTINISSNRWTDVALPTKFIGENKYTIVPTCEVFVQYCDKSHCGKGKQTYQLSPKELYVKSEVDYVIDLNYGSVSGSENIIKNIQVISNKNSFIDLFLDIDGITNVNNLPYGLSYNNKHIKGVPLKSGVYESVICLDTTLSRGISDYKIKFDIPNLERVL